MSHTNRTLELERNVDFLYAILSFYSSEKWQKKEKKTTERIFQQKPYALRKTGQTKADLS